MTAELSPAHEARLPGVEAIAAERQRQIEQEGWTIPHDVQEHGSGILARAAASYALPHTAVPPDIWPFEATAWKPTPDDRLRELAKAGALIAAEYDRIVRSIEEYGYDW